MYCTFHEVDHRGPPLSLAVALTTATATAVITIITSLR
jgi:hypothetical protein